MSLNTQLLARARRAPSQAAKHAALVQLVVDVLTLHDAAFIVADSVEDAVEADTRRERLRLMATDGASQSAVRYAEVVYQGDQGQPNGDSPDAAHEYLVAVYWGLGRDGFTAAAEAEFRAALESTDPAAPGLHWAIRAQEYLQTGEGTVVMTIDVPPVVSPRVFEGTSDKQYQDVFTLTISETGPI